MKLKDIVALPESHLDGYYSSLSAEEQAKFILIEDGSKEGTILISGPDGEEQIELNLLRLLVTTWADRTPVARIDKNRFRCFQPELSESEELQDAKDSCKRILTLVSKHLIADVVDEHLDLILDIVRNKEEEVLGLFELNNEMNTEIEDGAIEDL